MNKEPQDKNTLLHEAAILDVEPLNFVWQKVIVYPVISAYFYHFISAYYIRAYSD